MSKNTSHVRSRTLSRTGRNRLTFAGMALALALPLFAIFGSGCAETAATGKSVKIPEVQIQCRGGRCDISRTARAYVVYTTSGCNAPDFGAAVGGASDVNCTNIIGCALSIMSFSNTSGSTTTMPEGTYSVCVVIDYNGDYPGTGPAQTGDSAGKLDNQSITDGSSVVLTTFTDI